jgi:hypothetical protein
MRFLACVVLVCAACTSSGGTSPDPTSDASPGGSSAPNAPKILSLSTNLMTMTSSDKLVVSAVVTDPDGIDDLIGGTLTTTDGTSTFGAFATDASEGAYSISLTWADINATQPIDAPVDTTTPRAFRASFYDVAGHTVYRDVTVNLGCSDHRVACGGQCLIDACGVCGHTCTVCGDHVCSTGETAGNCPLDCAVCGDHVCSFGESAESCPADCPAVCGDQVCSPGESVASCAMDCAVCGDLVCSPGEEVSCPIDCL